jgi:gliding motility-associated-like protein
MNGAVDVPVDASISWTPVDGVPSYLIAIGTIPGGDDLVSERNIGSLPNYKPPMGLPENTDIYVTITLFFFQGGVAKITCGSEMFHTETVTNVPPCTFLNIPFDGQENVNPETNISWDYATGATGYRLSIGTTMGGTELLNNEDQGNVLTHNPIPELPPNTSIYVRVIPYNAIGNAGPCSEFLFTTSAVAPLPGCTSLVYPANGDTNVPLTPRLEWNAVPGAVGYRVTIGNSPSSGEVLLNTPIYATSTFILELEANRSFFVTIVPFNDSGVAIGCIQESFSTLLGCGPFFDPASGDLITLNPEIDFPETVSLCENEFPLNYSATDVAEGFRWYNIDPLGNETLISDTTDVVINVPGQYRYVAYNTILQPGGFVECESSQVFQVVTSEMATITSVTITEEAIGLRIAVQSEGNGDYEFAIDNSNGPYQNSNIFNNIPYGTHTLYVRDKNGCGIAEEQIVQDLTLEGFPKFFSPNGDGVNDYWQYIPPEMSGELTLVSIEIYNRYGQLLVQIDPNSRGWDGSINGGTLPAADYWFRARDNTNSELIGHFSLKR